VENHLRVAPRSESATPASKHRPNFLVIEYLAIECDRQRTVSAEHWLVAASNIDDAQPGVGKSTAAEVRDPKVIGTPVPDPSNHALQYRSISTRGIAVANARYTAHMRKGLSSLTRLGSLPFVAAFRHKGRRAAPGNLPRLQLDGADYTRRIAHRDNAIGNVGNNHAARANHCPFADNDTFEYGAIGSYPGVLSDEHGRNIAASRRALHQAAFRRVSRVGFGVCNVAVIRNHHARFKDYPPSYGDVNVVPYLRPGAEQKCWFILGSAARDVNFPCRDTLSST
jgi:hypothetical protein